MKEKKPLIAYLMSLLLFGSNGIVASYIALNSYEIVWTRTLIASLLMGFIFLLTRQKVRAFDNKVHFLFMLISGVAMGTSWMFLFEAYQQVGVSLATLAYYCGPVMVMALSPLMFREKMTWTKVAGLLAVMAGMVLVNRQALSEGKTVWGIVCGVLSAVTYALMVIFNKKASSITGLENVMWQLVTGFVTVTAFVGLKQGFAIHIPPDSVAPILILGLVNTGIGCYLYFTSIGKLPVQTVAICSYLDPFFAVLFSAVFLGETMSLIQGIGAVLILGGAAFGELFVIRKPVE